jgi:aspartate racemase
MHHIGILAHSADGAALCFLEIVRESARRLSEHDHPEITLSILPMAKSLTAYDKGNLTMVKSHLARTTQRLADGGCDFFVCPDNTAHIALEAPGNVLPLPGLHIAEIVAQQARADGRRCIGLLGTKWTMTGSVYPAAFARAGLAMKIPPSEERKIIDDIIFKELCQGVISNSARAQYIRIIEELKCAGCDSVALSCTEIPLLLTPDVSPLPTLDSTRLLAHAAVSVALGESPLPAWRGGPILGKR